MVHQVVGNVDAISYELATTTSNVLLFEMGFRVARHDDQGSRVVQSRAAMNPAKQLTGQCALRFSSSPIRERRRRLLVDSEWRRIRDGSQPVTDQQT